jgi:hypothetical protein
MTFLSPQNDIPELSNLSNSEKRKRFNQAYRVAYHSLGWRAVLYFIPVGVLVPLCDRLCQNWHPFSLSHPGVPIGAFIGSLISMSILNHHLMQGKRMINT